MNRFEVCPELCREPRVPRRTRNRSGWPAPPEHKDCDDDHRRHDQREQEKVRRRDCHIQRVRDTYVDLGRPHLVGALAGTDLDRVVAFADLPRVPAQLPRGTVGTRSDLRRLPDPSVDRDLDRVPGNGRHRTPDADRAGKAAAWGRIFDENPAEGDPVLNRRRLVSDQVPDAPT